MGGVVGKAANDAGVFIGNAFAAPFKALLGRSCENVCRGPWDLECFIEHFCVADMAKLLMISALSFLVLMFVYVLLKLGICQCAVRGLCKMSCAACEAYCCTIGDILCFLGRKLRSTRRVYHGRRRRRRRHDIEAMPYSSSEELGFSHSYTPRNISRKRRRRRESGIELSSRHRHVKLRSRQLSVRIGGKSRRRRLESNRRNCHRRRKVMVFKKRRVT